MHLCFAILAPKSAWLAHANVQAMKWTIVRNVRRNVKRVPKHAGKWWRNTFNLVAPVILNVKFALRNPERRAAVTGIYKPQRRGGAERRQNTILNFFAPPRLCGLIDGIDAELTSLHLTRYSLRTHSVRKHLTGLTPAALIA